MKGRFKMRSSSLILAALLLLSAGLFVVAQDGPPRGPHNGPAGGPPAGGPPHEKDRRDRSHRGREHHEPMSEEQLRESLEVLRLIDPDKAEKLEEYIQENPERIGRALREKFPHLSRFMAMRRYDPDGFDLRIQDLRLSRLSQKSARRLHEATETGDDALAAAELAVLEGLVTEHFDVRQRIREHDLARLEQQIELLRDQLDERAANRDALIAERVEEFIEHDKSDHW